MLTKKEIKKEIIDALGIETDSKFMTGLLVGIGCGALVGGIVALLVAPRSGAELRGELIDKGRTFTNRMNRTMSDSTKPTTNEPM